MKANVVFVHQEHPRAVLQVGREEFFAIQSKRRKDMGLGDDISGNLTIPDGKRFFNISKGTLIHVEVLGRFPTLEATIEALSVNVELDARIAID